MPPAHAEPVAPVANAASIAGTASAGEAALQSRWVVLVITGLLALQPVSTDLYLPALPTLQRALGASVAASQLTLSALIVAFGVGQLVCGPLADRHGRRPVLLVGLALYTVASVLSAAAQTIEALIAWRAVQGLGLAAAVTCGRSIVRDLYAPHEGARVMSRALGGLGVAAMLSPVIGGALAQAFGWHAALLAPALAGAAVLGLVALRFDETVPARQPAATRPRQVWRNWCAVAGHPTFRAWALLLCGTYGGLFCMLGASSFVFIEVLGTSRFAYGLMLASSSAAYIGGTLVCRRLLARHGLRGTVRRGAWLSGAGGLGMAALSLAGVGGVWAILVPQWLFAMGHGIHQPCGQAGVIGPFPEKAGTAASLSGFAMMVTAFGASLVLGATLGRSVYPLTLGVAFFGTVVFVVARGVVQRDGDPVMPRGSAR